MTPAIPGATSIPISGTAMDVWGIVFHSGIIALCGDLGHSRSTDGGRPWAAALSSRFRPAVLDNGRHHEATDN